MSLLTDFLAILTSPDVIVVGLICGFFFRQWKWLAAGAIVAAAIHEVVMSSMLVTYRFEFGVFLTALVAGAAWVLMGRAIGRIIGRRARRI